MEFKRQVLNRFHHSQAGDAYEMVMALKQTGTVAEYRERFETMSAPLSDASDEMLMGAFRNGLKEDIRADLRIMKFGSLQEMMDLAHNVEERNLVVEKNRDFLSKHLKTAATTKWTVGKPNMDWTRISGTGGSDPFRATIYNPVSSRNTNSKTQTAEKQNTQSSASSNANGSKTLSSQVRRLTDAEVAKKWSLGLCYRCDEKYSPTRKCKNKQLQVMILQPCDGEEEDDLGGVKPRTNRTL